MYIFRVVSKLEQNQMTREKYLRINRNFLNASILLYLARAHRRNEWLNLVLGTKKKKKNKTSTQKLNLDYYSPSRNGRCIIMCKHGSTENLIFWIIIKPYSATAVVYSQLKNAISIRQ